MTYSNLPLTDENIRDGDERFCRGRAHEITRDVSDFFRDVKHDARVKEYRNDGREKDDDRQDFESEDEPWSRFARRDLGIQESIPTYNTG